MKLVICDDMIGLCEYYKKVFMETEDIEVVDIVHNGEDCKKAVKDSSPDILLLDIQMNSSDEGISIIEELLEIKPDLKIIMLTGHKVDDYVFRAFALGAKEFLYKDLADKDIISKVRDVYNDKAVLDSGIAGILAKKSRDVMNKQRSLLFLINQITRLSKSEIEVLRGVYYGKTYREISTERYVEEGTIRAQASGILKKFETKSMKGLVKMLKEMQIFEFIDLYYKK